MTLKPALEGIPSFLDVPPAARVAAPPARARLQELPFGDLSWNDFERLCLRIVRREAEVEECRLYGTAGQAQEGIDLYARTKGAPKYFVYQCKRVEEFSPAEIRDAVDKFIGGGWSDQTQRFVLCSSMSFKRTQLDEELRKQKERLAKTSIDFDWWDCEKLNLILKDCPELVDDFFGRDWVEAFLGDEAAGRLGDRFDANATRAFRSEFADFYRRVFAVHDPGLTTDGPIPISTRFVTPDVLDMSLRVAAPTPSTQRRRDPAAAQQDFLGDGVERPPAHPERPNEPIEQRQAVDFWLLDGTRNVILGGPGAGKSTLLRFVVLDLLSSAPRWERLAQRWGCYFPVWIPFGFWVKHTAEKQPNSLEATMRAWLSSWTEDRLWPLVQKALADNRLLLIVDGLDEWTDHSSAQVTLNLLQVFVGRRDAPAILTSRPHGFRRLSFQTTDWRLGTLADFSTEQQTLLAQHWFTEHFKKHGLADGKTTTQVLVQDFLQELSRSPDLRELSRVPLLLSLLIYLRLSNVGIPAGRFRAYDRVIEHMLSTHPRLRKTAASVTTTTATSLGDDEIKKILAFLAYEMQQGGSANLIDDEAARKAVCRFLQDEEAGFGLNLRCANQVARDLLDIAEGELGVLVRHSPSQLGFFHRALQEYLAGYHLAATPIEQQLTIVEDKATDSQWSGIVLSLLHLVKRPEDLSRFFAVLTPRSTDAYDRYLVETL